MQATPYNGPIYPNPIGIEVATTFAHGAPTAPVPSSVAAVAPSVALNPAFADPGRIRLGPGATHAVPGPPPAGRGPKAAAIEFADTICLPGNVFLQLYIVYNVAAPAQRWANRIRYLRLDNKGRTITDVLLDHTALPPN
jgi:hypothetical protein